MRQLRRGVLHLWLFLVLALTALPAAPFAPTRAVVAADPIDSPATSTPRYAGFVLQLDAPPVAEVYAEVYAAAQSAEVTAASVAAATQAHLATVELAQQAVVAALADYDAHLLYRAQRVYNGVAVVAPVDQVDALAALPGVQAVYPIISKEPTNAKIGHLLHTPEVWAGIDRAGLTGAGISIAVIDTGIDYLHTMFGGPGTGYAENDTTIIGDVPNFPSAKIAGGYDFAGDTYDATPTSFFYQPIPAPDPDPMDCYDFGHGTHVSGTAAGLGVQANGDTYPGPYDTSIDLNDLALAPGMAPQAQIYALKVFGCRGSSDVVDAAIEWAVDPNQDGDFSDKVDVINMSLGSSFGTPYDSTVLAVENAAKLGIIVVTSAGNTGDVHYAVGSPGIAPHAIAVAASGIDASDPKAPVDMNMASFSARGPSRDGSRLKPDLAAPGVSTISAQQGTGSGGTAKSGTSMAAPVVAGIMALLRQAYPEVGSPGWRAEELKALVMNTAVYPVVQTGPDDEVNGYSLLRTGAGRIDPRAALQSPLIAYDTAAPAEVSVSFGMVDVAGEYTDVRSVRVANKGSTPIKVTVGYTSVRELPGAAIDVGAGRVLTVPAQSFATLPVTLTVDAGALAHVPDPTRLLTPPGNYPWPDEVGGYLTLTPADPARTAIHLPIHALPRVVSEVTVLGAPLDFGSTPSAVRPLTLTGETLAGATAPTQTVPLAGFFQLVHSSPPLAAPPPGATGLAPYAHADLRYVGVAGPVTVDDIPMLYFALVTHGEWATPHEVLFQIEIDINDDDVIDHRLSNRDADDIFSFSNTYTDAFVSMLEAYSQLRTIQGPLNVYAPTQLENRIFNTNVMVLPLQLPQVGANLTKLDFRVKAYSRDLPGSLTLLQPVDRTPKLELDLIQPQGIRLDPSAIPLQPIPGGKRVNIGFHRVSYVESHSQGLLVLLPHNPQATRTWVLPAVYGWPYSRYLPALRN